MSVDIDNARIVHYPSNPVRFEFDHEVSAVFPDMAVRSIPMYDEVHRLHVSLLRDVLSRDKVVVWDIGASRGRFFTEICNQFQIPPELGSPRFQFTAVDSSPSMLKYLHESMPWVRCIQGEAQGLPDMEEKADIISMFYVLQFIENPKHRVDVLTWAHRNLKPGGVLLLGQKLEITGTFEEQFTKEYYRFRVANGYSMQEIEAKTAALKNSMWPLSEAWIEDMCYLAGFWDYTVTSRWLQFSSSMCVSRGA